MNPTRYQLEIADQQTLPFDGDRLLDAITEILADHDIQTAEVSLAVVDDPTIRQLNNQYLQHDYETDVISFVLDWNESNQHLAAQLIVSTDTAKREGQQVGNSMEEELLLYVIHGTLHLVGYDDKNDAAAKEMRLAERDYLQRRNLIHRGFSDPANEKADPC